MPCLIGFNPLTLPGGQLQSITGTAGVAEYHSYTVNSGSAAYEAGSITETVQYGTSNGAHWRKTTTNYLGQVLREEEPSPAGANAVSVTTHTYNAKGQRVKTSRTGVADLIVGTGVRLQLADKPNREEPKQPGLPWSLAGSVAT